MSLDAGRKVAVLADMFELGDGSDDYHREVGKYAAANGVDILTISRMLTHKSVKNTQIYAKVVDERAREASEVISLK